MTEIITKVADLGEEVVVTLGRGKTQKKVLISTGVKPKKKSKEEFLEMIERMQKSTRKISKKYDYKDSYKEGYHKMLDEKYGL
ncbi:MAG: hypothetical protein WCK98_04990 [bacterium]